MNILKWAYLYGMLLLLVAFPTDMLLAQETLLPARDVHKKWGYIDTNGLFVLPPTYDFANPFNDGYASVRMGEDWFLISKEGKVVLDREIQVIKSKGEHKIVKSKNKWKLYTKDLQPLFQKSYDGMSFSSVPNQVFFSKGSSFKGVIDYNENEILPNTYDEIKSEFNVYITDSNRVKKVYNAKGQLILDGFDGEYQRISSNLIFPKKDVFILLNPYNNKLYAVDSVLEGSKRFIVAKNKGITLLLDEHLGVLDSNYSYHGSVNDSLFFYVKKNRGYVVHANGTRLFDGDFTGVSQFNDMLLVFKNGKKGLNELNGKSFIEFKYDQIMETDLGYYIVVNHGKSGVINKFGEVVIPCKYDEITVFSRLIKAKNKEAVDIFNLDEAGHVVEKTQFKKVFKLSIKKVGKGEGNSDENNTEAEGENPVYGNWRLIGGLWALFNEEGDTLIPPTFQRIRHYDKSQVTVVNKVNEVRGKTYSTVVRFGIVDHATGKYIARPVFQGIEEQNLKEKRNFDPVLAQLANNSYVLLFPNGVIKRLKYKFVDAMSDNGCYRVLIDPIYKNYEKGQEAFDLSPNTEWVNSNFESLPDVLLSFPYFLVGGKWGLIDRFGREILTPSYKYIGQGYKNTFIVRNQNDTFGVVDNSGRMLIPTRFKRIEYAKTSNGVYTFIVEDFNSACGYVNEKGEDVFGLKFGSASLFSEGYAMVTKRDGWYLKKLDGSEKKINENFRYVGVMKEGFIRVKQKKWNYLDSNGLFLLDRGYSRITEFQDGFAGIKSKYGWQIINAYGEVTHPKYYSTIQSIKDSMFIYGKNGAKGVSLVSGKRILKKKYKNIVFSRDGKWIKVEKKGKWGLFDSEGKRHCKIKYDAIVFPETEHYIGLLEQTAYIFSIHDKEVVTLPEVSEVLPIYKGQFVFRSAADTSRNLFGILSINGELVLAPEYTFISKIVENRYLFRSSKKECTSGVSNLDGEVLYIGTERTRNNFQHGLLIFKKGNDYHVIDTLGETVIAGSFEKVQQNDANSFWVKNEDGYELYNKNGFVSSAGSYDYVRTNNSNGISIVYVQGNYGLRRLNGEILLPEKYKSIQVLKESPSIIIAKNGNGYTYYNHTGKLIYKDPIGH